MDERMTRSWAEISLDALRHNARELKRVLPAKCKLLGVVKADAYGHGAVNAARILREEGAAYLAVACPEEALALRAAGDTGDILILGAVDAAYAPAMAEAGITLAVEEREKGEALAAALRPGQRLKVHLKLDTGMGRIGFPARDTAVLDGAAALMARENLNTEGVFTHFAVSDEPSGEEYTRAQFAAFQNAVRYLEEKSGKTFTLRHCANSGAMISYRDEGYCLDMVRPGLLTYGIYPGKEHGGLNLVPVMELKSRVAAITHHKRGDTVSYGRTFTCERDCTLAVLPIGYADGLHRALSGKAEMLIRGQRVRQIGRICMDVCMLDVTDVPDASAGDVVTVFGAGRDGAPTASELAVLAETIPYELVCAVSPRVPRVFLGI